MRKGQHIAVAVIFSIFLILITCQDSNSPEDVLTEVVEDQWGNTIDLTDYQDDIVVMNPFSPSNCGWCFFDGDFIRENYYYKTKQYGGKYFGISLFNSQKDIYSFQKHYREDAAVITSPISLHKKYHNNGVNIPSKIIATVITAPICSFNFIIYGKVNL